MFSDFIARFVKLCYIYANYMYLPISSMIFFVFLQLEILTNV